MTSQTFEQVLNSVQAQGSFTPAWKKFVKTKFFVQVQRAADNNPRNFALHVARDPQSGAQSVLISEERERLNKGDGDATAALYGADIVKMLAEDAAILVALSDRAFKIAQDRVQWLRSGVEAAQARAAAERDLAAAAKDDAPSAAPATVPLAVPVQATAAAPIPVPPPLDIVRPVMLDKAMPAPAGSPAFSPSLQRSGGMLDVSALSPRSVGLPNIGLAFYVPGGWSESPTSKGLIFFDPATGTKVETSAALRPGMSMEKWIQMRCDQLKFDMAFLTQLGDPYRIEGEEWRDRVQGFAIEYAGSFPGSGIESRCLLACIRVDGAVASVLITAPADVFENNWRLYKWLLSRIELNPPAPVLPAGEAGSADALPDSETPRMFGWSTNGRIGRLRALAYGAAAVAPLLLFTVALPYFVNTKNYYAKIGIVLMVICGFLSAFFNLRSMAMRLHDINRSGKWVLLIIACGMANGTQQVSGAGADAAAILGLLFAVVLYLIPGSDGVNDYGLPPAPNSTPIKAFGAVAIVLYLLLAAAPFLAPSLIGGFGVSTSNKQEVFSMPDGRVTVSMPGQPREIPTPARIQEQIGSIEQRQYQLKNGKRLYFVQTIENPPAGVTTEQLLSMGENVFSGQEGDTLLWRKETTIDGVHPGVELRVKTPEGELRAGLVVVVEKKLILMMLQAPDDPAVQAAIQTYFSSLKLR